MPVPLPSSRMRLPFRYLRFAKLVIQAQPKRRIRVFSTRTMRPAWFVCICRKKQSSIRSIFRIPKPREPQSPLMYSPNTRGCLPRGARRGGEESAQHQCSTPKVAWRWPASSRKASMYDMSAEAVVKTCYSAYESMHPQGFQAQCPLQTSGRQRHAHCAFGLPGA